MRAFRDSLRGVRFSIPTRALPRKASNTALACIACVECGLGRRGIIPGVGCGAKCMQDCGRVWVRRQLPSRRPRKCFVTLG